MVKNIQIKPIFAKSFFGMLGVVAANRSSRRIE